MEKGLQMKSCGVNTTGEEIAEGMVEPEQFYGFFNRCGGVPAARRATPVPVGFGYSMLAHLYGY